MHIHMYVCMYVCVYACTQLAGGSKETNSCILRHGTARPDRVLQKYSVKFYSASKLFTYQPTGCTYVILLNYCMYMHVATILSIAIYVQYKVYSVTPFSIKTDSGHLN